MCGCENIRYFLLNLNAIYRSVKFELQSKMLDIPKENILAIGDNTNDLEMILEFNGFAVASGNPFIISKASKIYPSIEALIEENI